MSRFAIVPLLLGAAGLVAGCPGSNSQAPAGARFDAVREIRPAEAPEAWCDAVPRGAKLTLPAAAAARPGGPLPRTPNERWVWINVWATWCAPCRREMPMLIRWHEQLVREGRDVDLWFVSIDDNARDLADFLRGHADVAPGTSIRLAAAKDFEPWLKKFQPDASGTIPVQILVAPGGAVRCVRSGSLSDGDYPTIKALIR